MLNRHTGTGRAVLLGFMLVTLLTGMTGLAVAHQPDDCGAAVDDGTFDSEQACQEHKLDHKFTSIGDFVVIIILGLAVPNGAYGFLEWMTAGANTEKDQKGRKRVRNTFVALGGATIIKIAVEVFTAFIGTGG